MSADRSLNYLFGLEKHGIKLGLDNIRLLCDAFGHPERSFRSVVVAGTNGKGSVAAMTETALGVSGLNTGRFTSPHLVELEERFVVRGKRVSRPQLVDLAARLQNTIDGLKESGRLEAPPTFFEATTAIALLLFQQVHAQVAVLEVGMGGRFDATNVVSPAAVVITSVDLDHQQYLGRTLPAIAFEKAGVIKPGTLVVTGETKSPALDVVRRVCHERGARLIEARRDVTTQVTVRDGQTEIVMNTPRRRYGPLVLSLRGRHQVANAEVAVRLLEELDLSHTIPGAAIEAGLTRTHWPGRLELVRAANGRQVLLDAAHNVAAANALGSYLSEVYPEGVPLVLAAMSDKDVAGMLRALGPSVTRVICTSFRHARALSAGALAKIAADTCPDLPRAVVDSPATALETALENSDVVCAAGSIYLVGELTHLLFPTSGDPDAPVPIPR